MKHTLYIIVALLPSLLFSCREKGEEQQLLERIEQTWQQCESALPEAQMRAEKMRDSVGKSSELVRQKYQLLTIRLRDKCDIVPSNPDSAIRTLAYFADRADAIDKERAYYYLGSAYRDLKDYPRAVSQFLKAVDIAAQSKVADTLIWQNALSQLRYLYMLQLNYEEELKVALKAVELATASPVPSKGGEDGEGKMPQQNLACYLMDAASAYSDLNDTLHCLAYCDQAFRTLQEERFPQRYGRTLANMLAIYSNYNHFEKVDTLLWHLSQLAENLRPHNYELCLAKYHESANNTDSAIAHYGICYDKEKSLTGRYEASAGLQRCYMQKGDFRQAALWGQHLYETNDAIIAQRAFEQTQRARDEYIYHRDKEAEEAIMRRSQRIIFISVAAGLVLLSIVMALIAFYNFRKKRLMEEIIGKDKLLRSVEEEIRQRQNELKQKGQEIMLLERQLNDAEHTIAASKRQMEATMKELEQRIMINRELTRMNLMGNATETEDDIIAHFREVASGHAILKPNSWKELMATIETMYPGFLERVQGRMQKRLREPQLYTICLLKAGLRPMQITKIMNSKIQTVWNRVKRAEEICGDLLTTS